MTWNHLPVRLDNEGLKGLHAGMPLKIILLYYAHSLRPKCHTIEHQSRVRTFTSLLEHRLRAKL